jgi:uncharacterized membrane protein YfcA
MSPADAPPAFMILAITSAFLVGLSKGGLPAVGSLAVPVLALVISPVVAAGMLLPIFLASDLVGLWLYRHVFSVRNLAILVPAGILGVALGWATAEMISEQRVMLAVGFVGLFYCFSSWLYGPQRPPQPADLPRGVFWGALSGFSSFVAHSGAAPYQVYVLPQRLEKLVFAGTSTILFAIINYVKVVPYAFLGQLSPQNLRMSLILIPVSIVGAFAGAKATRIIPERQFFALVKAALFLISVKLVYDGLL